MPEHGTAARLLVLICVYRARSRFAWQIGASEAGGSVQICLPRLPNEIFVVLISSGFNFEEQRSVFNQGVPKVFK